MLNPDLDCDKAFKNIFNVADRERRVEVSYHILHIQDSNGGSNVFLCSKWASWKSPVQSLFLFTYMMLHESLNGSYSKKHVKINHTNSFNIDGPPVSVNSMKSMGIAFFHFFTFFILKFLPRKCNQYRSITDMFKGTLKVFPFPCQDIFSSWKTTSPAYTSIFLAS